MIESEKGTRFNPLSALCSDSLGMRALSEKVSYVFAPAS